MNSRPHAQLIGFFILVAPVACALPIAHAAGLPATSLHAQDDTHAHPKLISATSLLSRGSPNLLAITFTIDEHWHLYADAQNDTGQAPKLKLDLPPGVTASALRFPPAKRLIQADSVLDHIYEDKLTLVFEINISEKFQGDSLTLHGTLDWLECADVCRFGKGTVSLTLPVAKSIANPKPTAEGKLILEAIKALPSVTLPKDAKVELSPTDQPTHATVFVPGAQTLIFTPDNSSVAIRDLINSGEAKGETLKLELDSPKTGQMLSGVLEVRNKIESRWYRITKPLHESNSAGPRAVETAPPASVPAAR